mgnify:FL=1
MECLTYEGIRHGFQEFLKGCSGILELNSSGTIANETYAWSLLIYTFTKLNVWKVKTMEFVNGHTYIFHFGTYFYFSLKHNFSLSYKTT